MLLLVALAAAGPEVPPPNRLTTWDAPLRGDGTRVGMIVETRDARSVRVEVRDGGVWREVPEIWRNGVLAVHSLDLAGTTREIRLRSADTARIVSLDWDLFVPAGEPRASHPRPPTPGVLPSQLAAIGVVSRADWGADGTTCTTTEDDWYRMAIHHTAGGQTYGGTVQGAVQALQAYAMGSGDYCDIPYQFLVGYDGSLWEGRPYDYYSGATGGGNNDGNIAVSFLGCYHPSDCSTSHPVTDAMMESGQLLVQTLASLHAVPSDSDSIRGHRDWPGNSTACPGEWLYDRLDELRAPLLPDYAATFVGQSFPLAHESALPLVLGAESSGYIELANAGGATWAPGSTFLAPTPRDVASALADETWISTTRAATVDATTAPGETGRFTFTLQGNAAGEYTQTFGLVQEGVTWFADDGGPADDLLQVRVSVTAPSGGDDTAADTSDTPGPDSGGPGAPGDPAGPPGQRVALSELGGCGCASGDPALGLGTALLGLALTRRRRAV